MDENDKTTEVTEDKVFEEQPAEPKRNSKEKILTVRLSDEEWEMVRALKIKPHYVNIAQYIRDGLIHLYQTRTNKAGRVK